MVVITQLWSVLGFSETTGNPVVTFCMTALEPGFLQNHAGACSQSKLG